MSSVAERREMKPRTDCVGVSHHALREREEVEMDATGGLTFGLGTRKSEGNAIVDGRAVAYVKRENQACSG